MNSLTAFLVLNWSFWALVSLLIVQTLAKFLHKHTSPCRFPLAFPLTDSDTIKSVRVGGKNQGRSGNRKQRYFFIWPNRERASTYECPLPSLCFAVQCINKDGRYVLWFADIFSSPLQLLNGFRKKHIRKQVLKSMSSTICVFWPICQQRRKMVQYLLAQYQTLWALLYYIDTKHFVSIA